MAGVTDDHIVVDQRGHCVVAAKVDGARFELRTTQNVAALIRRSEMLLLHKRNKWF